MKRMTMTALAIAVPLACGTDTGRERTTFEVDVAGIDHVSTNDLGWEVELTRADFTIGDLAFFEGDPLFAWSDLWIGRAYAHPGHYVEGEALAELLEPATFDLLQSVPVLYGTADGVTGDYRSAEVRVDRVVLAGTASKDGRTVTFEWSGDINTNVEGIAFGAIVESPTGHVELRVDLAKWFERADFSDAEDGVLVDESQPHRALLRGLVNTSGFLFERKETP